MKTLTPKETVAELNKYIIGQETAKQAVAIALRNRWRRMRVPEAIRNEITPKNILMIGPTGVGKTEIARRLAHLAQAPFIKVEATKFTEVGYVGRDVESIIRDLLDIAVKQTREYEMEKVSKQAEELALERVLDVLVPPPTNSLNEGQSEVNDNSARKTFRYKVQAGELDDKEIEIELSTTIGVEIISPPGMEEMTGQLQDMLQNMGNSKKKQRRVKIKEALKLLTEEEAGKFLDGDDIKLRSIQRVEQHGIVFLDELDKVTHRSEGGGVDVSREGVQRDLLPLIEGNTVSTKYGMIKTDHILFIASGSFHLSKPSDLIPELQGRLPIRVELSPLETHDFVRILTEPDTSLTKQYKLLMETEGIKLDFTDDAIQRIAEMSWQINEATENIGARRLHTVMEKLLENLSYEMANESNVSVVIDADYVNEHLQDLVSDQDISRYIL